MDIDFAFWLVVLTGVTGTVVLLDKLWFRKQRVEGAVEPWPVDWSRSFFPVLAVVLVLRSFLAEPFTIPSGSMLPTLQVGDYIVVNKYAYGLRLPVIGTKILPVSEPQRGDILVFRFPQKPSTSFIKRIVGLPGDIIRFEGHRVWLNGVELPLEPVAREVEIRGGAELTYHQSLGDHRFVIRYEEGRPAFTEATEVQVPPGHFFVMGDNRDNSYDSRGWGFVPDRLIVGKAVYIWMHKEPGLHLPGFARNGTVYPLDTRQQ